METQADSLQVALDQLANGSDQEFFKAKLGLGRVVSEAGTPGQEEKRKEVSRRLAEALFKGDKFSIPARCEIARRLGDIGGDTEVPALESALVDLELREAARFGLDRIPTAAATEALVKAAKRSIGSRFRAGIMNSLGQRDGKDVMEALVEATGEEDPEVRVAAAEALANHAEPAAGKAILAALKHESGALSAQHELRVHKAMLRFGAALEEAGKKDEAKDVYKQIVAVTVAGTEPQQKAAQRALDRLG